MNHPRIPPIASPHGADTFPFAPRLDEKQVCIEVNLRPAALVRYSVFEMLMPLSAGMSAGAAFLFTIVDFLLFPGIYRYFGWPCIPLVFALHLAVFPLLIVPFALCARLCSQRCFLMRVCATGVVKSLARRDIHFSWHKINRVTELRGDIWLGSLTDGCFILRDSFASRDEACEFVEIIRELKRTRGSVWRDKWTGRIFGVQSDEGEGARNIPL